MTNKKFKKCSGRNCPMQVGYPVDQCDLGDSCNGYTPIQSSFLTYEDIMDRYCCGINRAKTIICSVRACCGGGKLPKGKILASELAYWESIPIKREVRI